MNESIRGRRVAYFGGSFDPPHLGHLTVARAAHMALGLDLVLFAPVGAQPLKPHGSTASFDDRVAMTRMAIEGEPGMGLTLADAPRGAPNYSVDALGRVRAELPQHSTLYFLMGADSFLSFRRWHHAAEIPFLAPLIVASRPGQKLNDLRSGLPAGLTVDAAAQARKNVEGIELVCYRIANPAGETTPFYLLPDLHVEISASEIRAQVRAGEPGTRELLPSAVWEYVRARGLYREAGNSEEEPGEGDHGTGI
jgi:nicotinate-nucleotide adenylyltransferase